MAALIIWTVSFSSVPVASCHIRVMYFDSVTFTLLNHYFLQLQWINFPAGIILPYLIKCAAFDLSMLLAMFP